MGYFDFKRFEQIDESAFQATRPYPWVNPEKLLTEDGFERLYRTLPDISTFTCSFDVQRKNRQTAHNRYTLEYHDRVAVAEPWREFLDELRGPRYRDNLCRLLAVRSLTLNFHWHYTPNGCAVSPHTDSVRKAGSHIFYFNTEQDWQPDWGGQTLVLDDGGRLSNRSAPALEAFECKAAAQSIGNRSFLFGRTNRSWHAVREIRCPTDRLRKVFTVVINTDRPRDKIRSLFSRNSFRRY